MSLSMPSRRLLRGAPPSANSLLPALQSLSVAPTSHGTAVGAARPIHTTPPNQWLWSRKNKNKTENSLEDQIGGSQKSRQSALSRLTGRVEAPAMFQDDLSTPDTTAAGQPSTPGKPKKKPRVYTFTGVSLVKEHLARAVDPDPRSRVRWERKMVIRQVQHGTNPFSKEPRAARIARTERQITARSPWLATSTKKLVHLARQIQGKTVSDALVQMRYSKKKMAQEVKYQLELARDLAVVERGMGLGEALRAEKVKNGEEVEEPRPVKIQDKDGKWITIEDPTRMYVAEAWVNRGPWRGIVPDYRARGRIFYKHKPTTSISIVLKEEKTRLREHEERQAKKLRQGPWIHLPDRPVTAQRQYYSW